MKKMLIYLLLATVFLVTEHLGEEVFVSHQNENLYFQGRILRFEEASGLVWPGSSVRIRFKGTGAKVLLKDDSGQNFYNVIIDSDSVFILRMDTTKKWYTLAQGLTDKEHTIELFKRTEYPLGKTLFYGISLNEGSEILPVPIPERTIEFYGNSITCGYGIEDYSGKDCQDSIYTNNYLTYAAITARRFNANYYCIAKSGIGIMVSWFPEIMPEVWRRQDPLDPLSSWDFKKVTPDIVVVNLFQNDSWIVNKPDYEEFKRRFDQTKPSEDFIINSYYNFIRQIRLVYPRAHIICALGSMDITREGSPWPGYLEKAVQRFNDKKIYTCFFPYKETPGHPKVEEQKAMADQLEEFINSNIQW